ncbi:39S ribosomal protein L50, mitochondrial [Anthonomus grandis grandis]|uniref:39S ribosomal protein L50, mitochondrial n=1 Tax=Anthonomus grandis grandis TaxID=2921223 RepID=UPI0021662A5F|nr:39S ribosomal protein L50, mitochondrial [Anthonomus grandis grandis]
MMAAFYRHGMLKTAQILNPKTVCPRWYATKAEKRKGLDRKPTPKLDSTAQSIADKGFLRPQRQYTPPENLEQTLTELFKESIGSTDLTTKLTNLSARFNLFAACADKLGRTIPNSMLHQIETLEDVLKFYATPVDTRTPMDRMRTMVLPENLHVQFEYHRWHPATDAKFGGRTAFPESSTLVTGLRSREKYKGHLQKIKYPQY